MLLLFLAAQIGKLAAHVVVRLVTVEWVGKPHRLVFRAAGKNDPHSGVGIHVEFVVGAQSQLPPVVVVFACFKRFFFKRIDIHRYLLSFAYIFAQGRKNDTFEKVFLWEIICIIVVAPALLHSP